MDDEPLNWSQIEDRLDRMPRGSKSRLATLLAMDRSQLARTLRSRSFPKTDQAKIIEGFLGGKSAEPLAPRARTREGRVPLYGFAAGQQGDRFAFNEGQVLDWVELPRGMSLNGEYFVVQTMGSSMEPRIWAGERKLVQRGVPPGRDQDVVIEFNDDTAVLKTFKSIRDGWVHVQQYNPDESLKYPLTSVRAMHAIFPL